MERERSSVGENYLSNAVYLHPHLELAYSVKEASLIGQRSKLDRPKEQAYLANEDNNVGFMV